MKKIYNNPECKILLLQSEDIMALSNGATYDDAAAANNDNIWNWSY